MLNLGVGADLFGAFIWLVRLLILGLIALALWQGKTWKRKLIYVGLILLVVSASLVPGRIQQWEYQRKYKVAKAVFDERCKTAGEKVYKTVDDVEGVFLSHVRANDITENEANPYWLDAGLANEYGGKGYIANFLMWQNSKSYALNSTPSNDSALPGYRYVDVEEKVGVMLRYTLNKSGEIGERGYPYLTKSEVKGAPARYAVSYINLTNPGDREHWVAGTTVTVIDTQSSEVLAQGTWYSFEPGLGSRAGGRQPWRFAQSCPELRAGKERAPTRFFVTQVLKPKKGE